MQVLTINHLNMSSMLYDMPDMASLENLLDALLKRLLILTFRFGVWV